LSAAAGIRCAATALALLAPLFGAAFCFNQQKASHIAGRKAIWSGRTGAAMQRKTSGGPRISAAAPWR
jgi:hypothetical protein